MKESILRNENDTIVQLKDNPYKIHSVAFNSKTRTDRLEKKFCAYALLLNLLETYHMSFQGASIVTPTSKNVVDFDSAVDILRNEMDEIRKKMGEYH